MLQSGGRSTRPGRSKPLSQRFSVCLGLVYDLRWGVPELVGGGRFCRGGQSASDLDRPSLVDADADQVAGGIPNRPKTGAAVLGDGDRGHGSGQNLNPAFAAGGGNPNRALAGAAEAARETELFLPDPEPPPTEAPRLAVVGELEEIGVHSNVTLRMRFHRTTSIAGSSRRSPAVSRCDCCRARFGSEAARASKRMDRLTRSG